MKKIYLVLAVVIGFALVFTQTGFTKEQFLEKEWDRIDHEYFPEEIVVKFKPWVNQVAIDNLNSIHGTSIFFSSHRAGFKRLKIPKNKTVSEMVELFNRDPYVEYAEPNYIAYASWLPNDPFYTYQWHLDKINMEDAWNLTKGDPGVIVAVIDTGVAYENYTEGSYWYAKQYYQAPDLAYTRFVPGYDFINNDSHPNDDNGHGTHVTGTIAQSTNNGMGTAGIAPNCSIMPVKVLNKSGSGPYTAIANGIIWAADHGAKVINMSLGGSSSSTTLENALAYAYNKGVTIVCAAGNNGQPTLLYPAAYNNYCIAVGATRYDDARASYSNYGPGLDLVAPGGDLDVDQNGDGYGDGVLQQTFGSSFNDWGYWFYEGTSMAAPHVSGVAALLISNGVAMTPDDVRNVLQSTAKDLGLPGYDTEYGWGRVDAFAALQYSSVPNDTTPPTPNPMTWATPPYAASSTSIAMAATTATDSGSPSTPPVSYYFDFVGSPTGGTGGADSGWQSSTSYTNTGLQPNHRYGYQVKAKDSAPTPNETSSSPTVYKYTLANAPAAALFSNVTSTCIRANWTANGNPNGTEYFCENTTTGANSGWATNLYWENCSLGCNTSYSFQVKTKNGDGVETGWTPLGSQSTQVCPPDNTAPSPNPMTWATPPYATGTTSIAMVASTASDPTTPINYFFDFVGSPTLGAGGNDSVWQLGASYTNSGLQANHQYGYQVKARDGANPNNETGYSATRYVYTAIETPAGISFGTVTSTSIQVQSSSTPSGLNRGSSGLWNENTTNSTNSGWKQNSDPWTSNSLSPNTNYNFKSKAKNGDGAETGYSPVASKRTLANVPVAASFSNVTQTCIRANWTANGNPNGTEYWCENTTVGTNSGWTTNTYWDSIGLSLGTSYSFRVMARNAEGTPTDWISLGSQSCIQQQTEEFTFTGTVLPSREGSRHAINVKVGATSMYVKLTWSATDDLRLRVYNPYGTIVAQVDKSTSSNKVEETTLQNPVMGSWKVAAFSESVLRSISYTIKVTVNY